MRDKDADAGVLDTYVAFLRGVNVGGNNTVSMARLRPCFEGLGHHDVRTHGNSGNVVFRSAPGNPGELEAAIEEALATEFAIPIRVLVRSLEEMEGVVAAIPKDWMDRSDRKSDKTILRHNDIIFLRHSIDSPQIVRDLQPKPDIEELHYQPGVLFWSVNVRDFGKSNVSKIIGTAIYKEMTVRGAGTVRKVYDMMLAIVTDVEGRDG